MSARLLADAAACTAAVLLVIALVLVARALRRISAARERVVASFAGGVSLAFVTLELFVELVEGTAHEPHVRAGPDPVHTIATFVLVGAAVAFAANIYAERRSESWVTYGVALSPQLAYRALVGAALDEEFHLSLSAFVVFWLAMALHLGVAEHRLESSYPHEHRGWARVLASAAPLAGAALWGLAEPTVASFHMLLGVVSGATILGIFREEIPSVKDTSAAAFFGGIAVFGAIVQARWWL